MPKPRPQIALAVLVLISLAGLGGGWWLGRGALPLSNSDSAGADSRVVATSGANSKPVNSGQVPTVARSESRGPRPQFVNVAERLGITFNYVRGETGESWLPETMGGGVAWLDFDGDGRLDLFFVQGCQLPRDDSGRHAATLFRNSGGDAWHEVPRWAGPSNARYGIGVAVADANNDGFDDVLVTNFGDDTFYVNEGDGTFRECGAAVGLASPLWGTSAAFGDLDRDGDLDLFVANYVEHDTSIVCRSPGSGRRKYCGPDYFQGQHSLLFDNRGDGEFADLSAASGIVRPDSKGLGVVIADLLDDQFTDEVLPEIFVANDLRPNFLFRHAASGASGRPDPALVRFDEVGFELGAAVNAEGIREANMGIACGDYDEDGDLDLYVTHYYMEHDTLWQNQSGRGFRDVTKVAGLSLPTLRQLSWGTNFIDFDNDGWLDLFVTSGHLNSEDGSNTPYAMHPQLFRNLGSQGKPVRFADVSPQAGAYFAETFVGRASATADFDRDGDLDLAVGHHHKPAAVLENRTAGRGNAIGFVLIGRESNRSAIGARVTCVMEAAGAERRLVREIIGGGSYLSADSRDVLVGLGPAERVKELQIRWPSGRCGRFENIEAGGYWLLREGEPPRRFREFEKAGEDVER